MLGIDDAIAAEVIGEAAEVGSEVSSGVEGLSESSLGEEFSADSFVLHSGDFYDTSADESFDVDSGGEVSESTSHEMETSDVNISESADLSSCEMADNNLCPNSIEDEFSPEMFSETENNEANSLENKAENVSDTTSDTENNDGKVIETEENAEKDDAPRKIKTINDSLEGQKHPDTGVPYERKVVETDTGEKVEGVFPLFESEFDAQLPEELELATDKKQFDECNRQLKEKYDSDPAFKSKFTPEQQADIDEGRTPEGYTWHHNEEKGKMQLVDSDTHWDTRHTGGRNIWGGGSENR